MAVQVAEDDDDMDQNTDTKQIVNKQTPSYTHIHTYVCTLCYLTVWFMP